LARPKFIKDVDFPPNPRLRGWVGTFSEAFQNYERAVETAGNEGRANPELAGLSPRLRQFRQMLRPLDDAALGRLAREAATQTRFNFGRTMRLFAPLYVSNECVNNCQYCGFSRDNLDIFRVTLEEDQVEAEAAHLAAQGFRNILLVAGEHPKYVSNGYLERCIRRVLPHAPSVGIEVAPMETADYIPLVQAGSETLVVYQESYDREAYRVMHTAGPKRNFDWRLDALERGYAAGFRRLQAAALMGLSPDWRLEATRLAMHVEHLLRNCWRAFVSIGLPRLRPCAGGITPRAELSDREFIQYICALRLTFPQVGITLSTRENAAFRDVLFPLGVTTASAGSHTEPGGYTGAGREKLHHTVRGREVALQAEEKSKDTSATGQFSIADDRTPAQISEVLLRLGLEPVWKDWDHALAPEEAA
jgi:2-iminoacetate synthase